MFAGHFGLAAAVKARAPEMPLWALFPAVSMAMEGLAYLNRSGHIWPFVNHVK